MVWPTPSPRVRHAVVASPSARLTASNETALPPPSTDGDAVEEALMAAGRSGPTGADDDAGGWSSITGPGGVIAAVGRAADTSASPEDSSSPTVASTNPTTPCPLR